MPRAYSQRSFRTFALTASSAAACTQSGVYRWTAHSISLIGAVGSNLQHAWTAALMRLSSPGEKLKNDDDDWGRALSSSS